MSASEYLPLYQPFTNRTHIRNGRRFDQSEIAQIIDANKCCLEMYGRYVNSSIAYILVSVCPADGITSYCPIWVDTIKKWISIKIRRVSVDGYKAAYMVDTVWWRNFGLPKGSRIPRPPWNMTQGGGFNLKSPWKLIKTVFVTLVTDGRFPWRHAYCIRRFAVFHQG